MKQSNQTGFRMFAAVLVTAFAAMAYLPPMVSPATAQETQEDAQICMAKSTSKRSGGKSINTIMVRESNQAAMRSRGFRKTACKSTKQRQADYQEQICKFARITPANVQAEFSRDHGATPAELCGATK